MRTSATGTSISNAGLPQRGFTLIEILVVMLIIGIMVVGTVLATGVAHGDRELEQERDRILALTAHLRDQASLQNREYGMRCFDGGYEFLVYDPRSGLWQREEGDDTLRARRLPRGLAFELVVEGRKVILPEQEVPPEALAPQIMLYSSGELSLFGLTLQREPDGAGVRLAPSADTDAIEARDLADAPA